MDKYEYKLRLEEIKTLNKKGRFQESAQIADTIDWKKVRNTSTLGIISDVYKINRRFDDAREILLLANEKSPQNRRIVYALCDLAIKTGQVVEAVEYYKQFVQLSPNDNSKYILLYKIYEAQDISLEERIAVLKEYKKREYNEKWAYELAFLYHRVGLATECVEECDQLILWFGEGKYVLKAMELKRLYVPLSPAQQQLYDSQYGGRNAVEEEPQEAPAQEQTQAVRSAESKEKADLDIHVKPMDMGQYNTINLQEALAASMRDVFAVDREEVKTASPEQEEPDLMKNQQTVYAAENGNGEYQEDISRVLEESDQWDAQATGQLDMEETKLAADAVDAAEPVSVQPTQSTPQVYADEEPTLPVASSSGECAYVAEPVNAQPEAPILAAQPAPEQTPAVTDPADAGMQEIHPAVVETPWMPMETDKIEHIQGVEIQEKAAAVPERQPERKAVVGNTKIERQTTGQMNIEEVLKEWERLKKENEEKRKQETRQWMLQQTGSLFDDFDESSRNGVLEQLQREESLPVEDEKAPANAENQEAPVGDRAAVETTAAKAPLVDPSRETETEELEEIEEAPPVVDAAQGYTEQNAETEAQDAEPVQRYAKQAAPERIGAPATEETKASRQEAPTPQPETSGEEKQLQERVSQQQAAERVRSMTKAERKLFAQFIPTKRAMRQLVAALDEISLSAYTGNVVITGMPGSGTLKLTKCMIREIQASDGNFSGKVAKVNAELINLYEVIRDDVDGLLRELSAFTNDRECFYAVRDWDRDPESYAQISRVRRAARIVYLNKTCYNGLFRVNSAGEFNTPFGRYKNPGIVDEEGLRAVHRYFARADLRFFCGDYAQVLDLLPPGAFAYLDPPYDPVSDTANFTGYAKSGFGREEQVRLRECCDKLTARGVRFMLSNSATAFIREQYANYRITVVNARRAVNSNASKRGCVEEVVIRNYE